MKADETFPLPWELLLWSSGPRQRYALTDFRLVVRRQNRTVRELALDDIKSVRLSQSPWQRLSGTASVHVMSRRGGEPLVLSNIHRAPELALILQLRADDLLTGDARASDLAFVRSALGPDARPVLRSHRALALTATAIFAVLFGVIGAARNSALPPVAYGADDPIAPNGKKQSTEEIAAFMESEVMPFARHALAPLVGGASNVTCETCHGEDGRQRQWRMPGVRALPEPQLRLAGLERARLWLDPQVRNAVYGYLAESDNSSIAAYMRQVVMPGMAKLMHRPAYDFAKSYGYNRSRAAVGCYHCHLVE